jgi:hypothetical protein
MWKPFYEKIDRLPQNGSTEICSDICYLLVTNVHDFTHVMPTLGVSCFRFESFDLFYLGWTISKVG